MNLKLFTVLAGVVLAGVVFSAGSGEAQVAYSSYNNSCTAYNACWQRMKLPSGSRSNLSDAQRQKLDACSDAGGPDKFFGKGKGGPGKLRPCP